MDDTVAGARRSVPTLTGLDARTLVLVEACVQRMQDSVEDWAEHFLHLVRAQVPGYAVLTDGEIRESARSFLRDEVRELTSLRIPDDALRRRLEAMALHRSARGMTPETLTLGYQVGSRSLLDLMDRIAAEVGLPADLLLAVHDSTWEFANEAAAVFARVSRELSVERTRLDAERRATFARDILRGVADRDRLDREALLFGLDPHALYVPLAARISAVAGDTVRRTLAHALRTAPERLLFADLGTTLGCIAPHTVRTRNGFGDLGDAVIGVGPESMLPDLGAGFTDAVLALETAERFALVGPVTLAELGLKPLVIEANALAERLEQRYFRGEGTGAGFAAEVERTVRVLLDCDQDVRASARQLAVHPNTVRYRVSRFQKVTGLDLAHTEDLVTVWWLLNRRRAKTWP